MAIKWKPFSHYEKKIIDVMVTFFTPEQLDALTNDQIDKLKGKILTCLVDSGSVTSMGMRKFYSSLIRMKKQ